MDKIAPTPVCWGCNNEVCIGRPICAICARKFLSEAENRGEKPMTDVEKIAVDVCTAILNELN